MVTAYLRRPLGPARREACSRRGRVLRRLEGAGPLALPPMPATPQQLRCCDLRHKTMKLVPKPRDKPLDHGSITDHPIDGMLLTEHEIADLTGYVQAAAQIAG